MSAPPCDEHPADEGLRLELKPRRSVEGHVDGAWWPRSRDLRQELATVIAGLDPRNGHLERVGYHRAMWDPTGHERLRTPAGRVALDGFAAFAPDTVWLVVGGNRRTRLHLVVVPPETSPDAAAAVLARASAADNRESVAELLHGT